ncbi:MAG: hypothetical protein FJW36_00675 [Acidobacteria bacterium]|nr:hypothetical protein [Acidobacteriota bacterium]
MEDFIKRFEAGTLTKEEWTHEAHLRMAYWYVWSYPPIEAGVRIRVGIRHLNECMGGANTEDAGFHETLTEFWIREVRAMGPERMDEVLALPAGLWKRDYGWNVAKDRRARREYVAPQVGYR